MCEVMEELVIILKTLGAIIFMEEGTTHRRRKQRIGKVVGCLTRWTTDVGKASQTFSPGLSSHEASSASCCGYLLQHLERKVVRGQVKL